MELEFFCQPGTDLEWFRFWREYCHQWLLSLHIQDENLRLRDHVIAGSLPITKVCRRHE